MALRETEVCVGLLVLAVLCGSVGGSAFEHTAGRRQASVCRAPDPACDIFPPDYNRYSSPSLSDASEGDPTVIFFQLFLSSTIGLCTEKQRLTFTGLIEYSWHDARLNLSHLLGAHQSVRVAQDIVSLIWKPSISLVPVAQIVELNSAEGIQAHVSSDLRITLTFSIYVSLYCKMDMFFYPFDVHICDMAIVNVGSDDRQSILRWIGDERSPFRVSEQSIFWSPADDGMGSFALSYILPLSVVDNLRSGRRRTRLVVRVRMRRLLTGALMKIYTPSIITVVLSWIGFWRDPKQVHFRVLLCSLCFVLISFQQSSQVVIGRHDHSVVSTDLWYIICYLFVTASLVEFLVILKMEGLANWQPAWNPNLSASDVTASPALSTKFLMTVTPSEVDDACKTLFPLIFFFWVAAYGIGFGSHLLVFGHFANVEASNQEEL
ncbi:glycine receptor subunit alpha-2-like [Ornithodoros turicata]|uniref:glycine receptor subunit alpha-2-like n=1 Tax=Ornithodoros turicata TaxID=34597 RepID=UPI003139E010